MPSVAEVVVWGWMSAGPEAVTVAPASTPPLLSVTVPTTRPRSPWAAAGTAAKAAAKTRKIRMLRAMRGWLELMDPSCLATDERPLPGADLHADAPGHGTWFSG